MFAHYIKTHFEKASFISGGAQAQCRCPVHGDDRPSLLIDVRTGKMACQACGYSSWLLDHSQSYGLPEPPLKPEQEQFRRKMEEKKASSSSDGQRWRFVGEYIYRRSDGTRHHRVRKREDKQFFQSHWDGTAWKNGLKTELGYKIDLIPYNLPQIHAAEPEQPILWVEGEKDADRAMAAGFLATTTPGGADNASKCSDWTAFEGRFVTILPDNDEAGEEYLRAVAVKLLQAGALVSVLRLPGLPAKGDLSDWFAAGGTREELETLLATAEDYEIPYSELPKPEILITDRDPADVLADVLKVLNHYADLFNRGQELVQLCEAYGKTPAHLRPLSKDDLLCLLTERAIFLEAKRTKSGETFERVYPPGWVAKLVLSAVWQFAPIKRLVQVPYLNRSGHLVTVEGLDEETGNYLLPLYPDLVLPTQVSEAEAKASARWLGHSFLGDFKFAAEYYRTHTVAMLFQPVVSDFIDDNSPLEVINATRPGSGKTLLGRALQRAHTPSGFAEITENPDNNHFRSEVFSVLRNAPSSLMIDNVRSNLEQDWLHGLITARETDYRLLGVSQTVKVASPPQWLVTANNPTLHPEMLRRVFPVRLDPQHEMPWRRSTDEFRIPNLLRWIEENRKEILRNIYTCVIYWLQTGQQRGKRVLGSFREWSEVLGGIVESCGLEGFLANLDDETESVDLRTIQMRELFKIWNSRRGKEWITAAEASGIALGNDLFVDMLADKTPGGQARSMGRLLASERDNSYGGLLLTRKIQKGQMVYCLTKVGNNAPTPPDGSGGPPGGKYQVSLVGLEPQKPQTHHKPTTKPTTIGSDNQAVSSGDGGFGGFDPVSPHTHVYAHARETLSEESTKPTNPPRGYFGQGEDLSVAEWERVERACRLRRTKLRSGFGKSKAWPPDVVPLVESGRWVPPHDLGGPAPQVKVEDSLADVGKAIDSLWDFL